MGAVAVTSPRQGQLPTPATDRRSGLPGSRLLWVQSMVSRSRAGQQGGRPGGRQLLTSGGWEQREGMSRDTIPGPTPCSTTLDALWMSPLVHHLPVGPRQIGALPVLLHGCTTASSSASEHAHVPVCVGRGGRRVLGIFPGEASLLLSGDLGHTEPEVTPRLQSQGELCSAILR